MTTIEANKTSKDVFYTVIDGSKCEDYIKLKNRNNKEKIDLTDEGVVLTEENKKKIMIPKGFAHGFIVLSDEAEFTYKCDDVYNHEAEGGLKWDDPDVGIEWPMGDLKPEDLISLTNGQCADIIKN